MKVIFVVLNGSPADRPMLNTAADIAAGLAAHIEVLHFRPDPREAVPWIGEGASPEILQQLLAQVERDAGEREASALATFDEWSAAAGLRVSDSPRAFPGVTVSWRSEVGDPARLLGVRSRLADLVLIQRAADNRDPTATATLEGVIFNGGRPVLLLSPDSGSLRPGITITILWNGSSEAARAVSAAIPLLQTAKQVHVITAEEKARSAEAHLSLRRYLGWHGVEAKVSPLRLSEPSVPESLLSEAESLGTDLLVMGAYSHSRLRELVLGGVTRHVLNHPTKPVLLAH